MICSQFAPLTAYFTTFFLNNSMKIPLSQRLITFFCFFYLVSFAQKKPDIYSTAAAIDSIPIHEVVVTATRSGTNPFKTTEAIQLLDKKHLKMTQARTTPELFLNTPGVFVQKTNHGGGSPFLRGLTGNQTLLLLDGIRLNNATYRYGPNQYLNTVDAFTLGRAEILRGSGSVQYGSDAMGGTIQVFSKDLNLQDNCTWDTDILGRFASSGMEQTGRADLSYAGPQMAARGGFTYRQFGDLVGGDTTGFQTPSGYEEYAFDIKAAFKVAQHLKLTLVHQEVKQKKVPLYHKVQLENFQINEMNPQFRRLSYARLEGDSPRPLWRNWYILVGRQQTDEVRISQKKANNIRRKEQDQVETYSLSTNINSQITPNWSANSGIELYHDLVGSTRIDQNTSDLSSQEKRGLYPDGSKMLSYALFSLHTWKYQNWSFNGGIRLNAFQIRIQDETLGSVALKPAAVVYTGSVQRMFQKHWNVFLSYNSGFRAPNIDDLGTLGIVDFRYEVPNYKLKPERAHNTQLGIKYQQNRFDMALFVYRNELRQLVSRIKTLDTIQGYPVYQKENVEKAYIQGIEYQWTYQVAKPLFLEGFITYTYGQNLSKREPVRRIPPLNARFALRYQPKSRLFATLECLMASAQTRLAQGDRDDNRIPAGGTPGWTIFNLSGGFDWKWMQIQLNFQNLFNVDYRLHGSGINGVGRSFVVTAATHF
jgi:hemoglobin/transferrin/lactoferrin receptor protein